MTYERPELNPVYGSSSTWVSIRLSPVISMRTVMAPVLNSWRISPLGYVGTRGCNGSGISSLVTTHGLTGTKVSMDLLSITCIEGRVQKRHVVRRSSRAPGRRCTSASAKDTMSYTSSAIHGHDPLPLPSRIGRRLRSPAPGSQGVAGLLRGRTQRRDSGAPLPELTRFSITDPVRLRAALETVPSFRARLRGQEAALGVSRIAAPVFDGSAVVAALSIAVPRERFGRPTGPGTLVVIRRLLEHLWSCGTPVPTAHLDRRSREQDQY